MTLNYYFTHMKQSGSSLVDEGVSVEAVEFSLTPVEKQNFDAHDKQLFNRAKQYRPDGLEKKKSFSLFSQ